MGTNKQGQQTVSKGRVTDGFTIVEVVLFLAISALLAVLLLGGWTAMINSQRYKDSTRTLQSFLQQQYNLTYNVENGVSNASCTRTGAGTVDIEPDTGSAVARGQSGCVLMGRYIVIRNGTDVQVDTIVGLDQQEDDSASDLDSIRLFQPQRVDAQIGLSDNELQIPWQASVVGAGGDSTPRNYAVAIIRAPLTGTVHTFVQEFTGDVPVVTDMVTMSNESRDINLCLDPGVALAGGRMGVVIGAYASSQGAVRLITAGSIC